MPVQSISDLVQSIMLNLLNRSSLLLGHGDGHAHRFGNSWLSDPVRSGCNSRGAGWKKGLTISSTEVRTRLHTVPQAAELTDPVH